MAKSSGTSPWDIFAGYLLVKIGKFLGVRARRLAFRWRRALAPLWTGMVLWLIAGLMHWLAPGYWWTLLVPPAAGIAFAVLGPRLSERWNRIAMAVVPSTLDTGTVGKLDRPVERIYFGALCGYVGIWLAWRAGWGPSGGTELAWQIGVLIFGGIWWFHRRIRVAGRADKYARKWARLADRDRCPATLTTLVGSKVMRAEMRGKTAVLRVKLAEAFTAEVAGRLTENLCSFYGLRRGAIFTRAVAEQASQVEFHFLPRDPWRGKLAHPAPALGEYLSLAKLGKRFPMGVTAMGLEDFYELQHTQVIGATGSGKSAWLHSLMRWLAPARDCLLVAIDMAGGATMAAWRKALALPLATDLESALWVLARVLAFVEARERALGLSEDDDAEDSYEPSESTPWLILIIDEFPDLISLGGKEVIKLISRIAKRARKTGVRIILAAQNATKEDTGSKEMQAQMRCTVGLSLDQLQSRNLWGTLERLGWTSTNLRDGQYLMRDDFHPVPEPAKGYWVERKDRLAAAAYAGELGKAAEPAAWAALCGTEGVTVAPEHQDESVPEDEVERYLVQEGPARADHLVEVLGLSRATVYRRLRKLYRAGTAHSRDGVWHPGPAPADEEVPA